MWGMRQVGRLTQWKDEQGYGFITPKGGGDSVFVHIKSFSGRKRPAINDIVNYTVVYDDKDRPRADNVEFEVYPTTAEGTSIQGPGILAFAVFFLSLVVNSVLRGSLPFAVLGLYLVASTIAFMAYQRDKSKAENHQWRISEDTLHLWSLLGGWPGAALAQKLLHHKSKKRSFQVVYWFTVVLNSLGFFWLLLSPGSASVRFWIVLDFGERTRRAVASSRDGCKHPP